MVSLLEWEDHSFEFVPKMNHFYLLLIENYIRRNALQPMLITIGAYTKLRFNEKLNACVKIVS